MIRGSGKNLATSLGLVIVGFGAIAAAILFLNACGARHEEKAIADNPANVNTSPAARLGDTQVVTPARSPTPPNPRPNASTETKTVKSPTSVSPDSQGQQNSSAQSTQAPTSTQTLPGIGTGHSTGSDVGPGNGGGTGINRVNTSRGNPGNIDYSRVFSSREVDQRVRILEKPEPVYTAAARQNQINGTVVLSVVFTANGQVTDFKILRGLTDGLNESAIAAARRIKFTPATIDGRPVSMYIQLAYNFNLY